MEALLEVAGAAKVLKVSEGYVRLLCRNKAVPALKVGKAWKIRPADLEKFVANLLKEGRKNAARR